MVLSAKTRRSDQACSTSSVVFNVDSSMLYHLSSDSLNVICDRLPLRSLSMKFSI